MNQAQPHPTPEHILHMGMAFFGSKVLLSAVKLDIFTELAARKTMSAAEIKSHLKFQCTDRHLYDYLDSLVALGFLTREGLLETGRYANAADSDIFLDKAKPGYIGGMLVMANNRLYPFWSDLEEGLRTGHAQNEIKHGGDDLFAALYQSPDRLREFIHAMSGVQMGNFMAFAQKFDFSGRKTLADVGGSGAMLSIMVAKHNPHMHCTSFDLPPVAPIADDNIQKFGAGAQVHTAAGDFFADPLPAADVIVMGNILHDWDEEKKLILMKKAYDTLPAGGAYVAIENIIDDDRRQNAFGMMMSLNMLIETAHGFDYSYADFCRWARACGYTRTELIPLAGPSSAAVAYK